MLAKLMRRRSARARIALDDGPLTVRAGADQPKRLRCLYAFDVTTAHKPVVTGRLMVAFTGSPAP
jgi:hypothetical protein